MCKCHHVNALYQLIAMQYTILKAILRNRRFCLSSNEYSVTNKYQHFTEIKGLDSSVFTDNRNIFNKILTFIAIKHMYEDDADLGL